MIERAIENWLTKTNERNYQIAFCQVLLKKGHKVIYISSHRPMEQGKDIITIDPHGVCHAYQLKTGDIDLSAWRKISGEIVELMQVPVVHPSVDKNKVHKAYLVTNGNVIDEVRVQVDQRNEDNVRKNRNYSHLDIINKESLLKEFIDAQGEFMPKELDDFDLLLKLYLSDGKDFLYKERFAKFVFNTLFKFDYKQKANIINAISSSVVIISYMLHHHQEEENYYAIFEAWTLLAGFIIYYATKNNLNNHDFESSLNLIELELKRNLILLKEEAIGRADFIEGHPFSDGDIIYRARVTIVLGAICALENDLFENEGSYDDENKTLKIINDYKKFLWFWGESAFSYLFQICKYLKRKNEGTEAKNILKIILSGIAQKNAYKSEEGFPNPYYSVQDIINSKYGLSTEPLDFSQFVGSAYLLKPLIHILARSGERQFLEQEWRRLSKIYCKEFLFNNDEDIFLWRAEEGINQQETLNATESWKRLQEEASNVSAVPDIYKNYKNILSYFVLVCPFRINDKIYLLLDGA